MLVDSENVNEEFLVYLFTSTNTYQTPSIEVHDTSQNKQKLKG